MKRRLSFMAALLLVFALLLPLAACGGKDNGPAAPALEEETALRTETEALEETTAPGETEPGGEEKEESTTVPEEGGTTAATEEGTTKEGETTAVTAAAAAAVPGTPAEVLAAYTAVMNKAKKEAKFFRKLEYEQIGNDTNFEADWINHPEVLSAINKIGAVSREDAMKADMYTKGVTDMYAHLPLYHFPVGCMVKDPGVFTKATARQLPGGNIELTLVMKPEENPEPPKPGDTASPSRTGEMFNPIPKSMVDDILNGPIVKLAFWSGPPEINTKYFDCASKLVYNPRTQQIVTLRQEYYVRIDILRGKAFGFLNIAGYATAEGVTACDNFKY